MDILTYGILNKKVEEAKNVSDAKITEAVNTYLDENPPTTGATAEQIAQIGKNVADISELKTDLTDKVDFSKPQSLTAQQQTQAQSNIGIHKVTQAEYDALTDTNGIYIIVEE